MFFLLYFLIKLCVNFRDFKWSTSLFVFSLEVTIKIIFAVFISNPIFTTAVKDYLLRLF